MVVTRNANKKRNERIVDKTEESRHLECKAGRRSKPLCEDYAPPPMSSLCMLCRSRPNISRNMSSTLRETPRTHTITKRVELVRHERLAVTRHPQRSVCDGRTYTPRHGSILRAQSECRSSNDPLSELCQPEGIHSMNSDVYEGARHTYLCVA